MIARLIYVYGPIIQMIVGLLVALRYWNKVGAKICVGYYLLRVAFLFTAWPLIHKIPVDIKVWMVHAQWLADEGLFPVVDFPTAYHLGFNFLLWLSYKILHSPYSIMFMFNIFEMASIPLMYKALKDIFDEKISKRAVILFVSSPLCWSCNLAGQDEPIIIFFVSLILYSLSRSKFMFSALSAFGCFAATKILVPIYFWVPFFVARWKGVVLLAGALCSYWVFAIVLGVNPFDFRSSIDLTKPAGSLMNAGFVRGSIWYYMQSVPKYVHFILLFGSWSVSALVFLKSIMSDKLEFQLRLRLSCVLMSICGLEFFVFYRVCYYPYMLPFLPFALSAVQFLKLRNKINVKFVVIAFVLWLGFLAHKEDGNKWMYLLGYTIDYGIYGGYILFIMTFMLGVKEYLTSPWQGIKTLLKPSRM